MSFDQCFLTKNKNKHSLPSRFAPTGVVYSQASNGTRGPLACPARQRFFFPRPACARVIEGVRGFAFLLNFVYLALLSKAF